ncbi:MAG: class I SAM-dependent methyltransferase [Thermoflexus sp.]|jgi:16S rRNA (guanine1207-N2)-methyltransferase|nr:class I SAM-dependent methyltransferase [Thermoflexus sp.]
MGVTDYYVWREFEDRIGNERIRWAGKPGLEIWSHVDPGVALIAQVMEVGPQDHVLDLHCGVGWLGVLAARRTAGRIVLASDHGLAVEAARRTMAMNGLEDRALLIHGDGIPGLPPEAFDVVFLNIPKGKEVAQRLVRIAAWALKPGGRLYLAGPKRGGIEGIIAYAADLFGKAPVWAYGGGYRVAVATRPPDLSLEPPGEDFVEHEATVRGRTWRFFTRPGLFSWSALDEGTRRLIEQMEIRPQDHVLDLGCGYGIVGVIAGHEARQGRVVMVDLSAAALEASRRTLSLYELPHVEVRRSDGIDGVRGERFDVVVTNPPIHQGFGVEREVATQFVHDAPAVLRPGGRLYLVGAVVLPYRALIEQAFGNVEILFDNRRYRVYRAIHRPRRLR